MFIPDSDCKKETHKRTFFSLSLFSLFLSLFLSLPSSGAQPGRAGDAFCAFPAALSLSRIEHRGDGKRGGVRVRIESGKNPTGVDDCDVFREAVSSKKRCIWRRCMFFRFPREDADTAATTASARELITALKEPRRAGHRAPIPDG